MKAGDYLHGFFLGTRDALYEKNRKSITITILEINPSAIGRLIALFERAVGLYASLIVSMHITSLEWKQVKKLLLQYLMLEDQ